MVEYIIAGLGNPGEDYVATRHNAGFDVVDLLAEKAGVRYWKNEGGALTGKCIIAGHEVVLAKPQSFMNCSGGPVKTLLGIYKVPVSGLIVVHDEMDVEPGVVRVKSGGGLAGHNGLKSLAEKLTTQDFVRVRVGTGRPPGKMDMATYVLAKLKGEQAETFRAGVERGAEAVAYLLDVGLAKAQQRYNTTDKAK